VFKYAANARSCTAIGPECCGIIHEGGGVTQFALIRPPMQSTSGCSSKARFIAHTQSVPGSPSSSRNAMSGAVVFSTPVFLAYETPWRGSNT